MTENDGRTEDAWNEDAWPADASGDDAGVTDGGEGSEGAEDPGSPVPSGDHESLRQELADLRDRHLRLAAEFDNFRRRSSSEMGQAGTRGQAALVSRIVEVLDDLDRVTTLDPEAATAEAILEGVAMVEKKLFRVLEETGLERIDPVGEPFDPNSMEALLRIPADDPEDDDRVGQLLQLGFLFKGHLIRPARVGVLKYDE